MSGNIRFAPIMLVLSLLLLSGSVHAIGIGPSSIVYDFEPGMNFTIDYILLSDKDVDIYIKGDLAEYVTTSVDEMDCTPPCKYAPFSATFNLPDELDPPGIYDTRIGAVEKMPTSGGIGSREGIEAVLLIKVPFPGKYAKIEIRTQSVKVGEMVHFTATIDSHGKENITGVTRLEIFDSDGVKVATMYSDEVFVLTRGTTDVTFSWDTAGVKEGIYTAVATYEYGGDKPATTRKDFRVGDILIKIIDVLNNETVQDGIAKFIVGVESFWNSDIKDVYATISVYDDDGSSVGASKSSNINIKPWSKGLLTMYWDTEDVGPGTYDATITVFYHNKTAVTNIETTIVPKAVFDYNLLLMAVLVIIAVAVAAVVIYLIRRKRGK